MSRLMTAIGPKRRFAASQRYVRSGGKPTYRHRSGDAINPLRTWCASRDRRLIAFWESLSTWSSTRMAYGFMRVNRARMAGEAMTLRIVEAVPHEISRRENELQLRRR